MTVTKIPARDWGKPFSINTGTTNSPVWTRIKGINNLTPSPSKNDADITDFDSEGWAEHFVAGRSMEFSIAGHYLVDPLDGTRDPGQKAVEELGLEVGIDSVGTFRFSPPGEKPIEFEASANVTAGGGGNDDPTAWEASLTVTGKPRRVS